MPRQQIDHGDVVEARFTYLTSAHDPRVVILVPEAYSDVVEREEWVFVRRHADGQLCQGHLHESLEGARACADGKNLSALWQDLAAIVADVQRRVNVEKGEYRRDGGTLSGDDWLAERGTCRGGSNHRVVRGRKGGTPPTKNTDKHRCSQAATVLAPARFLP